MRHTLIVEVEVDDDQMAKVNSTRVKQGIQPHSQVGYCENVIVDALKSVLVPQVAARELKVGRRLRSAQDTYATA